MNLNVKYLTKHIHTNKICKNQTCKLAGSLYMTMNGNYAQLLLFAVATHPRAGSYMRAENIIKLNISIHIRKFLIHTRSLPHQPVVRFSKTYNVNTLTSNHPEWPQSKWNFIEFNWLLLHFVTRAGRYQYRHSHTHIYNCICFGVTVGNKVQQWFNERRQYMHIYVLLNLIEILMSDGYGLTY